MYGQTTLPPTNPTALPPVSPIAPPPVRNNTAAENGMHPAKVVYSAGKLEVEADNSSLNQILRDVSRQTGMKITGGVVDERVYGTYGPSAPADVLAKLLVGTGSNMVLMESSVEGPKELILTPRQGGPTPPSPNAPGFDNDASSGDAPPSQQRPFSRPVIAPRIVAPSSVPTFENSPAASTPTSVGTTVTTVADPNDPQNGAKTPEQIYEQLRQLQQKQAQPPTNPQ